MGLEKNLSLTSQKINSMGTIHLLHVRLGTSWKQKLEWQVMNRITCPINYRDADGY